MVLYNNIFSQSVSELLSVSWDFFGVIFVILCLELTGTLVQLGSRGREAHAEVLGTGASIRVGFIAIEPLGCRMLVVVWLLVVRLLLLRLLVVIGSGAGLEAVARWRGNAAVKDAILTGSSTGRSSAATVVGTVRSGCGTITAILLARNGGVQESQFTGLVLFLGLLATKGHLQEGGKWRKTDL